MISASLQVTDRIRFMHWLTLVIISYNILETIEASEDSYITACKRGQYWIEEMCRRGNPLLNKTGMKYTKHRMGIVFFSGGVVCTT
jgi:hypothetical protein